MFMKHITTAELHGFKLGIKFPHGIAFYAIAFSKNRLCLALRVKFGCVRIAVKPNKYGQPGRKLNANKTFHARTLTLQCDPARFEVGAAKHLINNQ